MTTTITTRWTGLVTATSSIVHGGHSAGTTTLLRREQMITPAGELVEVPVISGNALRGRLRRIGEELLRDTLDYEGNLPLAAAHALRGGGALAKTSGEPLSGQRLRRVRELVPLIAAFGAASSGRIIDGSLMVGRLIPHLAQTEHLTGHPGPDVFTATQLETYTRLDETQSAGFAAMTTPTTGSGQVDLDALRALNEATGPAVFHVESFPAGTRFSTWIHLDRATPLTTAFLQDVLEEFAASGVLGGRRGIGHGRTRTVWERTPTPAAGQLVDWRAHLVERRDEVLAAIATLT